MSDIKEIWEDLRPDFERAIGDWEGDDREWIQEKIDNLTKAIEQNDN